MLPRIGLATAVALACLLALPASGLAGTFNVNEAADANDLTDNDGVCDVSATAGSQCSLRAAVQTANDNTTVTDTINLPAGDYTLSLDQLAIDSTLDIFGADSRTTRILAGPNERVLDVTGGPVDLHDLTVKDGVVADDGGGGIRHTSAQPLTLDKVTVRDNTVNTNGITLGGGGVAQVGTGTLTVIGSTVRDNVINVTDPVAGGTTTTGFGGGIDANGNAGTLNITNSTIDNNRVLGTNDQANALGGGLATARQTFLTNVTFADNFVGKFGNATAQGGNLRVSANTTTIKNTILTGGGDQSDKPNCDVVVGAVLTPQGKNLDSGTSCAFSAPHLSSTDPQLGIFQNNGGPTDTRLPSASSLAVDGALDCPAPFIDQRNITRPFGPACDIGAVERNEPAPAANGAPSSSGAPAGGGGAGSGAAGIVDVVPAVSGASSENPRFRVDPGGEAAQRKAPKGTAFRFRLSEAASVAITIQHRLLGRRVGKRCVKQTRANRKKKRCNLVKSLRTFTRQGTAGQNRIPFSGRISVGGRARSLKPGAYQASLVATDPAGNRSPAQVIRFRVVK